MTATTDPLMCLQQAECTVIDTIITTRSITITDADTATIALTTLPDIEVTTAHNITDPTGNLGNADRRCVILSTVVDKLVKYRKRGRTSAIDIFTILK